MLPIKSIECMLYMSRLATGINIIRRVCVRGMAWHGMVWCGVVRYNGCGCLAGMAYWCMHMYPGHITDIPSGIRLNGGEYQNPSYESRWNADKWQEPKIQLGKKQRVLTMMMWLLLLVSPAAIVASLFLLLLLLFHEPCVCVRVFGVLS